MAVRWLVTLAVFLVTNPADAHALRVFVDGHKITTTTTPLPYRHDLDAVCQTPSGALYVKTPRDLVALAPSGRVRWKRPATSAGSIAITRRAIVDGWVDRVTHRFGIVSVDPVTGREILRTDLGSTRGWYDVARVLVAPDGPDQVLVSTAFGTD